MVYCKIEKVKEDKIVLLNKYNFKKTIGEVEYKILTYGYTETEVVVQRNGIIQHVISWGERHKQTLEDVKPILDALNIEIKETPKTYKINVEGEYTEEELENLAKSGIKFKKVEV